MISYFCVLRSPCIIRNIQFRSFHSSLFAKQQTFRGDPYKILDVPKGSSLADIKKAFTKKAKEYHPDVNKDPSAALSFQNLNDAYRYLVSNIEAGVSVPDVVPEVPEVTEVPGMDFREKKMA